MRLLPILALIGGAVLLPLAGLVLMSLSQPDNYSFSWPLTLENYVTFATGGDPPLYPRILLRSVVISLITTVCVTLIAYPAAYFLAFHVRRAKYTMLMIITLPFWTSYLLRVFSWKVILGFDGLLNSSLMGLGLIDAPIEAFLHNPTAVVVTLTHAWIPFAVMPLFVSLEKIDRNLLEAAADLGYGAIGIFCRVVLPLSVPGIVAAACLVFIPTMADYVTASQVGGTSGLMIGNVVQSMFGKADNPALGAAISIVTMLTATAIALLGLKLLGAKRLQPGGTA